MNIFQALLEGMTFEAVAEFRSTSVSVVVWPRAPELAGALPPFVASEVPASLTAGLLGINLLSGVLRGDGEV